MATIDELRKIRFKKLESLKNSVFDAYPAKTKRNYQIKKALDNFSALSRSEKEIVLAGRVKSKRGHGGSVFFDIEDGSAKIQSFLRKDRVGEKSYTFFLENMDVGDFVETKGILFETKAGEKTLEVADYKILAKSLRPLPEKWHGLQDVEERFRKRYLDLIFNSEVKSKFETRSKIISLIRDFLEKEGFLEVETPILQPIYGGAEAKPFTTTLNAFDMKMYLRIAPELYLKRLLVGGFERVFEIGKCFRNEGVDRSHNPDFTMLEFYWAYADYKDLMKLTERLFVFLIKKIFSKTVISYEGKEIDFKIPWERIEYETLLRKHADIDILSANRESILNRARDLKVPVDEKMEKAQITDAIFKKYCLPKIWNPTFVINYPAGSKPLAKLLEGNKKHANFQLVIAGWEIVNAFSEQNDPLAQRKAFEDQESLFRKGLQEAQRMDEDFIEALEYGMPPAAGFGMGIDRLVVLLTDSHSLREVILFPTMKSRDK